MTDLDAALARIASLETAIGRIRDNAVIPPEYEDYYLVRRVDFEALDAHASEAAPVVRCGSCGADLSRHPTSATGHVCEAAPVVGLDPENLKDAIYALRGHPHAEATGGSRYWIDRAEVWFIVNQLAARLTQTRTLGTDR